MLFLTISISLLRLIGLINTVRFRGLLPIESNLVIMITLILAFISVIFRANHNHLDSVFYSQIEPTQIPRFCFRCSNANRGSTKPNTL